MKRDRSGEEMYDGEVIDRESIDDMADCLMLLSKVGSINSVVKGSGATTGLLPHGQRVFACKTCNREFPSFQALGGHRASHKKPRMLMDSSERDEPPKPKTHECSICGLEFPIGQALGGHMRRHRGELAGVAPASTLPKAVPVLKKSASSKRVMTLCLDLNLSPLENDLRLLLLGKLAPPAPAV